MHAFNRALSTCLLVIATMGSWTLAPHSASAQDFDPFALLFDEEDEQIDASQDAEAGFDDLNIVTLRLRELTLDDGFVVYETKGGICLPFIPLSEALEFPIIPSGDGNAEGWFIDSSRTVSVDFDSTLATVSGRDVMLPDDPFTTDALTEIFGMAFEHDARSLRVNVVPDEVLPLEAKLEREAFREDMLGKAPLQAREYERADNPYRWLSWPVADVGVDVSASSGGNIQMRFDIEAAGDILNTTGRIRTVGGNSGGILENLRVTLGRELWQGKRDGDLAARRIDAGDISTPPLPLVSRSINGAGVVITNRSALTAELFDETELRGPLPAGWEAELYHGDELLGFVTEPDSNGDYVFRDVPLISGYNRFTIKLYGPHGETEEREIKQFVGAELEPENETSYFFGVVDSRSPLVESFGLVEAGTADRKQLADLDDEEDLNAFEDRKDEALSALFDDTLDEDTPLTPGQSSRQGFKVVGSASRGLTDKLTVRLDARLDLGAEDGGDSAASVSLASSVAGGFAVGRVISNGKGMPALEGAFQRSILNRSNLSLRAISYGDLENEMSGTGSSRRTHLAQIRGNSFLPIAGRSIPVQTDLSYTRTANGNGLIDGSTRVSTTVANVRMTKSFNYFHSSSDTESRTHLGGDLLFSQRRAGMRLVGNLGYSLTGEAGLTNIGVSAQRGFGKDSLGTLAVNRDLSQHRSTLSLGWSKRFDRVSLSTTGRVSDDMEWSIGARLGFSLSRNPDSALPRFSSNSISRRGTVRGHAFIDDNLNGLFDMGETELEGVQLTFNGGTEAAESDETGQVVVENVSTTAVQTIGVNIASVEDPFLVPAVEGVSYVIRPGQTIDVPIALQPSGDLEGQVSILKGEHTLQTGGVPVEVLDRDGKVVAETLTDFDGYFYLDKLPLRELTVRVPNSALDEAGMVSEDLDISLTADEPSVLGASLTVFIN